MKRQLSELKKKQLIYIFLYSWYVYCLLPFAYDTIVKS